MPRAGEIYCHIFTPDNELYALLTDYTLKNCLSERTMAGSC